MFSNIVAASRHRGRSSRRTQWLQGVRSRTTIVSRIALEHPAARIRQSQRGALHFAAADHTDMQEIELDARNWRTPDDFRSALKSAIGAPIWHGDSLGAFLDSIFGGGLNTLKPPYIIKVVNTAGQSTELKALIQDLSSAIDDTRTRRLARTGEDVVVGLTIAE
ncbi:barstar family protein [Bradyrhizobium aeschynomenes]|uniref:barstar family protein n=1 Tax=Bradyrhizobium aeschynomenes TaxID=2734909 RepID=UPI001553ACEC|nr:hypothetical protein [Bradyrhizobium aeschynomenes]NPV23166.1 hypothetical protein [Bradyrhizobium aeschynomenes]